MGFASVVLYGGRILGTAQILMGLVLWIGLAPMLLPVHILNGLLLTVVLFAAAWIGHRAGAPLGVTLFAAAWALVLPAFGFAHPTILPGPLHWIVQAAHLVIGLVALALIERLARRARDARPRTRVARATGA